jgi:hypothetical protein
MGLLSGIPLEAAQSSSFSELLLRIDTMVISGMISMVEASDLREKVVSNRSIIQSAFSDIHHKPNTELLSELRLFLRKPIEYYTTYLTFIQFYCLLLKFSAVLPDTHVPFFCCNDNLAHRIVHWHLTWPGSYLIQ